MGSSIFNSACEVNGGLYKFSGLNTLACGKDLSAITGTSCFSPIQDMVYSCGRMSETCVIELIRPSLALMFYLVQWAMLLVSSCKDYVQFNCVNIT